MNLRRVIIAGLIASVVMGMIEMIYEAVAGAGFWSPVVFIGATVLRDLQSVPVPVPFHLAGVVLGLMGHMMNSVILGVIFAWIAARVTRSRLDLVRLGVIYALVIFGIMWYVVLPTVDPVMLKLNAIVFALSHVMWGAVLGLVISQASGRGAGLQAA